MNVKEKLLFDFRILLIALELLKIKSFQNKLNFM